MDRAGKGLQRERGQGSVGGVLYFATLDGGNGGGVLADVVIVVDMVRGFLEEGYPLSCGEAARRVIDPVGALIEERLGEGDTVLFTCDAHEPSDPEIALGVFPAHCMKGSVEAEIVPELQGLVPRGEVFEKHAYSGFTNPALDARVRALDPGRVTIVGVCTDVCVLHTAADAFYRGYRIETPEACVASFTEENHAFGLKHLRESLGAREPGA